MEMIKIHDKILLRNRSYFEHGYILINSFWWMKNVRISRNYLKKSYIGKAENMKVTIIDTNYRWYRGLIHATNSRKW